MSDKTITLTRDEYLVLLAVIDAAQMGENAHIAAQRRQERNHGVAPVAEGSEEEQAIWTAILDGFDKIRAA